MQEPRGVQVREAGAERGEEEACKGVIVGRGGGDIGNGKGRAGDGGRDGGGGRTGGVCRRDFGF